MEINLERPGHLTRVI